jgi:twinkle protein
MTAQRDESSFIHKEPCPSCGSRNNLARYSDGHAWCFGCGYRERGDADHLEQAPSQQKPGKPLLTEGTYESLVKRKLTEETCRKWGYTKNIYNGKPVQVATYFDENRRPVAQKVRFPNKDFIFLGETKDCGLYGQWLWRDGGKQVVITEGEIDALSVSQLQGNKWPVVSVPNGAQGASKAIRRSLEWLNKFEKIIFMFDNDEPGKAASEECVKLLPPGKAFVAHLALKDANEMLQAGRGAEVIDAIWGAKEFRPDGIVCAADLYDVMVNEDEGDAIPYPWQGLQGITHGIRRGELVCLTAGSGIGKSTACRELAHWLLTQGQKVGYIALEESVKITLRALVGIEMNKPLKISMEGIDDEELRTAFNSVTGSGNLYLYDHFGSLNSDHLLDRIRYMASGLGVGWVVLDHLSIVISGDESIGDERRAIDVAMTKLRSLVEETKIGLVLVSHLKRPEGKGHEEGAKTTLAQLRGSAAIAQLSDMVFGLERNQQDPENKDQTCIRVLKNRFTGETGVATCLHYDKTTGRLTEGDFSVEEEEGEF